MVGLITTKPSVFLSHMAYVPSFIRLPGSKGTRFAGTFFGAHKDGDIFFAVLRGTGVKMAFLHEVPDHEFSIYDAIVVESDPCFLGIDHETKIIPHVVPDGFQLTIKEICAGMGGIGLGSQSLGGQVIASLDHTPLACAHLRRNGHGHVLLHDLCNDRAKGDLHECGGFASTLTAGFPCQPHSAQGAQRGSADPRHQVYVEVLRTAYLMDCQCLVLECTPQAQFDYAVRRDLQDLATVKGWHIHDVTLALSHQWPCRRHRWWALLTPRSWTPMDIQKWPMDNDFNTIASIMPGWGIWNGDHEMELQLTVEELKAYSDRRHGDDKRLLDLQDMGPTFLHSYSTALEPCPCGCRQQGFSPGNLATRGLRGCFIVSRLHGQPRYLHPAELGALMGFPPAVIYGPSARADNCLLGQSASPLQAQWIFSYLLSQLEGISSTCAFERATTLLAQTKRQLVRNHFRIWSQESIPRVLTLKTPDGHEAKVLTAGTTTVAQLIHAETFTLQFGEMMHIYDGPCQLPAHQHLLDHGLHGTYSIVIQSTSTSPAPECQFMVGLTHQGQLHVIFVDAGSFLFEALNKEGILDVKHCSDASGRFFGLDFRFWGSIMLHTVSADHTLDEDIPMAFGLSSSATNLSGLNDRMMWSAMISLCGSVQSPYDEPPLLIPPALASCILAQSETKVQREALKLLFQCGNGSVYCFFAAQNHWALLCGTLEGQHLTWTYFDGFRSSLLSQADGLAWALSNLWGLDFCPVEPFSLLPQTLESSCGTEAIMHLCLILGLSGHFTIEDETRMHEWLVHHQSPKSAFTANGRPTKEVADKLSKLLLDKGVPADVVDQRVSDAVKVLGNPSISEALQTSNPWAALKGLASRPNTRFRWVQTDELKAHIDTQAKKKHGAAVPGAKQKKQTHKKTGVQIIDPETLSLIPDTFVDADGDEIGQLDFSEVTADATGLAFASLQQAKPFIEDAKTLSSTTLGLLIPAEVPKEFWGDAEMEHIRFPALCTVTQEPMLISGTLLNLSDGTIARKEHSCPDIPTLPTSIIKIQLFQDEVAVDWSVITSGPIRAILQMAPILKLCAGKQCGRDCAHFHAPVGDSLPGMILDLWGRAFHNQNGKVTKPELASLYQVMIRVPEVALDTVIRTTVKGLYLEPRDAQIKGPHPQYGVVWINGIDRDQALHLLRTSSHGLALARLGQRYGIRIPKQQEKEAHKELKPNDEYIAVAVKQVYSLYPLPHGLSRAQLSKVLVSWKWLARPLQPSRGTIHGQTWLVGSETAPPQPVLHAFDQDVLITLQKDATPQEARHNLIASQRTRKFLKEGHQPQQNIVNGDPWTSGQDPWNNWKGTNASSSSAPQPSRFEQLQQTIQDEVKKQVQTPPPGLGTNDEVKGMQVSIAELQAQGKQFQSWFKEAGSRMQQTEGQLKSLQSVVETQGRQVQQQISEIQSEVDNRTQILQSSLQGSIAAMSSDLDHKLTSQFDRFEALLAKNRRTE